MKVCDLTNFFSPQSGGVKTYLNQKSDYVAASGGRHQHVLIVPGSQDAVIHERGRATYQIAGKVPFWEKNYRFITNFARIQEIILAERPDVIEIGSPYLMPWAVRRVAKALDIPMVGFFHSNFPSAYIGRLGRKYLSEAFGGWCEKRAWDYARLIYGWCDKVIATSLFSVDSLVNARIDNVALIPFGVDTGLFTPTKRNGRLRRELGIDDRSVILLSVGRVSPEKDMDTLISAFRILRGLGDYHLLIIGAGPSASKVEEAGLNIEGLHYLGYVSHDKGLADYYASSDIFITASPRETFGLSPLEALASGVPVVAVSGGAVSELLSSETAEVTVSSSPESLAEAIESLTHRLSSELSKLCREQVEMKFSWTRTFDSIFALYKELIENRRK
jgi:alpha-1,6-mannosyltransferase